MSLSKCQSCGDLLKQDEAVTAKFSFKWNVLASSVAFAVDPKDLIYIQKTLRHERCPVMGPDPDEL
jgi:hypothetical protein